MFIFCNPTCLRIFDGGNSVSWCTLWGAYTRNLKPTRTWIGNRTLSKAVHAGTRRRQTHRRSSLFLTYDNCKCSTVFSPVFHCCWPTRLEFNSLLIFATLSQFFSSNYCGSVQIRNLLWWLKAHKFLCQLTKRGVRTKKPKHSFPFLPIKYEPRKTTAARNRRKQYNRTYTRNAQKINQPSFEFYLS